MQKSQNNLNIDLLGKHYPVLDKGFVKVIDVMGNDISIVQAARVSYNQGSKGLIKDTALINFLMRHKHTSPFEMCEIKLHVKVPIFIARQWIRYRTANVNEISGRYTQLPRDYYVPDINQVLSQGNTNKQKGGEILSLPKAERFIKIVEEASELAYSRYERALEIGVSREQARMLLPTNFYTEFYWKIDLHNLFNFLQQRLSKDAQAEIRAYAETIGVIVEQWCPAAYRAFLEARVLGCNLTGVEDKIIRRRLQGASIEEALYGQPLTSEQSAKLMNMFGEI